MCARGPGRSAGSAAAIRGAENGAARLWKSNAETKAIQPRLQQTGGGEDGCFRQTLRMLPRILFDLSFLNLRHV